MRKTISALMIAGALSLSACELPDPCADAGTPSVQDLEAVANGYEVERAGCELTPSGAWEVDD